MSFETADLPAYFLGEGKVNPFIKKHTKQQNPADGLP
jgi:hypothetical protein